MLAYWHFLYICVFVNFLYIFFKRRVLRSALPRLRAIIDGIDSDRIADTCVVGERQIIA